MKKSWSTSTRKKKIKAVLSMMNKQNERFIPVVPPLVDMMDMVTTDEELDYLLHMGTGSYGYEQARRASNLLDAEFHAFFDTVQRKGLVHVDTDPMGQDKYRLNAIAVGWYEVMMHYLMGSPEQKKFSEKWHEFFLYFKKFNFTPLRNLQDLFLRNYLKPVQGAAILDPAVGGKSKRKIIPINSKVSYEDAKVYPTFHINNLIEEYGARDAIYVFPCVCRQGNSVIESPCSFEIPRDSCIAFGSAAEVWANWGYGRHISKSEAMEILEAVRNNGAVHSVIHERDDCGLPAVAVCNCCWDCCGILKSYNMGAVALKYRATYTARIKNDKTCKGCGNCEKFCPTTAMRLKDKKVAFNVDRCIGCGQCAFQCRQNNIELYPNNRNVYLPILKQSEARIAL